MMLCEAAAYYKKQGLTLWDQMINIYEKYGYYREAQVSIVLKGAEGAEKIKELMDNLRKISLRLLENIKLKLLEIILQVLEKI